MPEVFEQQKEQGTMSIFIMSNIGILFGVLVMLALAIFETQIVVNV